MARGIRLSRLHLPSYTHARHRWSLKTPLESEWADDSVSLRAVSLLHECRWLTEWVRLRRCKQVTKVRLPESGFESSMCVVCLVTVLRTLPRCRIIKHIRLLRWVYLDVHPLDITRKLLSERLLAVHLVLRQHAELVDACHIFTRSFQHFACPIRIEPRTFP